MLKLTAQTFGVYFLWLPVPWGFLLAPPFQIELQGVGRRTAFQAWTFVTWAVLEGWLTQPESCGFRWMNCCEFLESWKIKGAAPMIHLVGWISVGLCFSWIHWLMIRWSRFGWTGFSWIFFDHSWFFRDRLRNSSELNQLPPRPCGIECVVSNVSDSLTLNQKCFQKTQKIMHS